MANNLMDRGKLTDAFVAHMKATVPTAIALVGDGAEEPAAGWPGGNVNQGLYVASVVVSTGDATPFSRDGINSRHTSWQASYGLRSIGAARQQADAVADVARAAAIAFSASTADIGGFTIMDVVFTRLAPVTRNDSTDPPIWQLDDNLTIFVSRQRT